MNRMARMLLACALSLPAPALAQQTTDPIAGRVVDELGGGIVDATVTVTNTDTGLFREFTSGGNGIRR